MGNSFLLGMAGNDLSSVIQKDCSVPVNDDVVENYSKQLFPLEVQCMVLEKNMLSAQMSTLF